MSDVQDYSSRLSDPNSRKMETFSYLPQLTAEELRKQLQYIVDKGWNPAIEHSEPENAMSNYWYMWKLPMFGETDIDTILKEVELCHKSNPGNHVRVIGYDNIKQSQGTAFIVHRAEIKL
uniref:Ribulose bisphosphate carboxylase small subunit n=1 Tax=uncultured Alphaproteobacteria bacterium TaxID=91750 RepID=A0A5Q5AQE6_9PROT|nr:ribulose-1,5-bisphosphate carboxylase small subunit [uncultured Alphaproteobacteria bacterium]QED22223.1 ribulose-1,5-bisphosphate carboxylase small subunit [uncultured Alphaproteobacteria bacterium]